MHVTISAVLHPGLVLDHQRSRIIRDVRLRGALPPPMDQDTDDQSPDNGSAIQKVFSLAFASASPEDTPYTRQPWSPSPSNAVYNDQYQS
ncbi:hypothetical protein PHLCEN_2v10692 [Hermanssonia centrifuga]|uniref:Uncharacterized protein n=1 Tax=Hermanssonia centrifuga TaxID=98765 RepID=A0A2R6NMW4_9APHY|nr:hypothetical protein PHLCEN_2v10692 [Hermanssonia centrifuga]